MGDGKRRAVQAVATLVAAVLALLVVVGLMSSRLGQRPTASAGNATPARLTAHDYGPPPAGVKLLYLHDPANASWLTGFDWSGAPSATVKLDGARSGALMAPDGQTFAIGLNAKGGTWDFLDRLGNPIPASPGISGGFLPIWADDSKHICSTGFDTSTLEWRLWTKLPGEESKLVRLVATDASLGDSNVRVVGCSFKNDVVIVERIGQAASPTEYWLIRLSDGSILLDKKRGGTDMAFLTASSDAILLAENSSKSIGQSDGPALATRIVRAADGDVVTTLDPSMGVLGFNGDDSAALVTFSPWVGGQPIHLGVVDLQSGHLVWQDDGRSPWFFGQFVAQPGGNSFAIAYPSSGNFPSPSTIVIVAADGSATTLDRQYTPAW